MLSDGVGMALSTWSTVLLAARLVKAVLVASPTWRDSMVIVRLPILLGIMHLCLLEVV